MLVLYGHYLTPPPPPPHHPLPTPYALSRECTDPLPGHIATTVDDDEWITGTFNWKPIITRHSAANIVRIWGSTI